MREDSITGIFLETPVWKDLMSTFNSNPVSRYWKYHTKHKVYVFVLHCDDALINYVPNGCSSGVISQMWAITVKWTFESIKMPLW